MNDTEPTKKRPMGFEIIEHRGRYLPFYDHADSGFSPISDKLKGTGSIVVYMGKIERDDPIDWLSRIYEVDTYCSIASETGRFDSRVLEDRIQIAPSVVREILGKQDIEESDVK